MSSRAHGTSRLAYQTTWAMLALALAFPIALMVFNPTLMFERGWEQYVGTTIYVAAVLTLARELRGISRNERGFEVAPALLPKSADAPAVVVALAPGRRPAAPPLADDLLLTNRVRQLLGGSDGKSTATFGHLMELNREASGLDQEQLAGRFTLTRYILYLLPVIGFIGTVEGISKALMNISRVLPMVKNLDGFMSNLTSVTSALQIAFDSTLLALFLSAALMLVQTLVFRRAEDLLARVDRWIVEHVLPRVGASDPVASGLIQALAPVLEQMRRDMAALFEPAAKSIEAQTSRWNESLGARIEQFATSVDRLPASLAGFQRGADAIGRIGGDLQAFAEAGQALKAGVATLSRIEQVLAAQAAPTAHLAEIKQGIERTCTAIEGLSSSFSTAYERSSRATQEQLAQTLGSLKDALDMLNVSMEQGNVLYRNIVKKMFDERGGHDSIRAA